VTPTSAWPRCDGYDRNHQAHPIERIAIPDQRDIIAGREGDFMSKQDGRKLTRRKFVKLAGGTVAAAGFTSGFLFPERALAQQKTLKIMQWSHFVPGYDKWFDGTFTKEWGAKHNTNVTVDHISTAEIPARAAAEVAAKKGHDLFMFVSPPAAYEQQVVDLGDVYAEVQ
jgi:multiple sugar transport system substrate-binding protein